MVALTVSFFKRPTLINNIESPNKKHLFLLRCDTSQAKLYGVKENNDKVDE